jgi:hypothetical protein
LFFFYPKAKRGKNRRYRRRASHEPEVIMFFGLTGKRKLDL